jgi:hypothetical protein
MKKMSKIQAARVKKQEKELAEMKEFFIENTTFDDGRQKSLPLRIDEATAFAEEENIKLFLAWVEEQKDVKTTPVTKYNPAGPDLFSDDGVEMPSSKKVYETPDLSAFPDRIKVILKGGQKTVWQKGSDSFKYNKFKIIDAETIKII